MASLIARFVSTVLLWEAGSDSSVSDEDAFRARSRERFDVYARLVAATTGVLCVVFWPTDLVALRRLPGVASAFVEWRVVGGLTAAVFLLLPRRGIVQRQGVAIFTVFGMTVFFSAGHAFGSVGGLELPYVHFSYLLPFMSIALPLAPAPRAVVTSLFGAAALAGVFLPFPDNRASPYAPMIVNMMVGAVALSLIFGELLMALLRQNFFQARQLARQAAALEAHSGLLEQRVVERTHELRQVLSHVETARTEERARLARELHDALGQELSAISYALAYTQTRFADDPAAIGPNLDELEDLLTRTRTTSRSIMSELRPDLLDDLGLAEAARWLTANSAERSGIDGTFRVEGDDAAVDADRRTAALRILQEALTNVERHAGARRIEVHLTLGSDALELSIADDGLGIGATPRPDGARRGMGLLGMRERAATLDGTVEVSARAEGGTVVRCRLPLPPRPSSGGATPSGIAAGTDEGARS